MSKLIKSFPDWYNETGAIFKAIAGLTGATEEFPWLENAATLDIEYIGNWSGDKTVSPLIDKMIEQNENETNPLVLTSAQKVVLATLIRNKYANKWTRLYAVMNAEYNPIENYSMVEEETPDIIHRHGVSDDYAAVDTHTTERDISRAETASNDYKVTDERKTATDFTVDTDTGSDAGVYGFNSAVDTPVQSNTATGNSTTTTTGDADKNTVTDEHTQTGGLTVRETASANNNVEEHTQTQTGYTEDTETGKRTLTRSGNIGVTTSQQMLESDVALWQWNFFESVFNDIDSVLTIPIYQIFKRGVCK